MTSTLPTMIGLGRLVDFIIRDAQGRRLRVTPTGERWLAWKADTRDLVVLYPGRGIGSALHSRDARRHLAFHGAWPRNARQMEWPACTGNRHELGLIESVTYTAGGIHSPSKGSHHWIHQFGDRGKRGHRSTAPQEANPFEDMLLPRLEGDHMGNLFVVRRSGSRYVVRDWIIG